MVYRVKKDLLCDKKGEMSVALCSLGKAGAGAQQAFLSFIF